MTLRNLLKIFTNGANRFLTVGFLSLLICLVAGVFHPRRVIESYLTSYFFWIGLSLGCLGILMLHHLVGGGWGFVIRRILEAGCATFLLMAILFLPVGIMPSLLYTWAGSQASSDPHLVHLRSYLNVPFFLIRAVLYFAVWQWMGYTLRKVSHVQDRPVPSNALERLRRISAPGLVVFFLTASFAMTDWGMSLEPHWFSTIYGMMVLTGHALAAFAWAILMAWSLRNQRELSAFSTDDHFHDLGKLLFAFVILWAYMSFSQYLIIWSGNLKEEIPWYLNRTRGGWQWAILSLIVFQFFLPFLLLLSRVNKRSVLRLAAICVLILAFRFVDIVWLIEPAFSPGRWNVNVFDVFAFLGIGGLWMYAVARHLDRHPLVPLYDPRLKEIYDQEKK